MRTLSTISWRTVSTSRTSAIARVASTRAANSATPRLGPVDTWHWPPCRPIYQPLPAARTGPDGPRDWGRRSLSPSDRDGHPEAMERSLDPHLTRRIRSAARIHDDPAGDRPVVGLGERGRARVRARKPSARRAPARQRDRPAWTLDADMAAIGSAWTRLVMRARSRRRGSSIAHAAKVSRSGP